VKSNKSIDQLVYVIMIQNAVVHERRNYGDYLKEFQQSVSASHFSDSEDYMKTTRRRKTTGESSEERGMQSESSIL